MLPVRFDDMPADWFCRHGSLYGADCLACAGNYVGATRDLELAAEEAAGEVTEVRPLRPERLLA